MTWGQASSGCAWAAPARRVRRRAGCRCAGPGPDAGSDRRSPTPATVRNGPPVRRSNRRCHGRSGCASPRRSRAARRCRHRRRRHRPAPRAGAAAFPQVAADAVVEGPAIGEHAIDPALEQGRHRPPVDRVDQHQGIGAIDARLLGEDVGGRRRLAAMHGVVGQAEARLEAFRRQVGGFRGMTGADHAFGDARGEGMCERRGW